MRDRISFLLIFVGAVFLRVIHLDKGISGDEGALLTYAQGGWSDILATLKTEAIYPPLSPFLLSQWLRMGASEIWIRLYFVMFGVGCCVLVYFIASEFAGRKFGMMAMALASLSPFLIWSSQFIRTYMEGTFWMLLATVFFVRVIKRERSDDRVFYVISSAVAIYTFYLNVLFLAAQLLFVSIFELRDRKRFWRWLVSYAMTGILFLPWLFEAAGQYGNVTAAKSFWNTKGFWMMEWINLGRYARHGASLFGFDPEFLSMGFSRMGLSRWLLLMMALAALGILFYFVYRIIGILYQRYSNKFVWLFVILALFPFILANLAEIFFYFRPYSKIFSYPHAVFIVLMTAFFYDFDRRKYIIRASFIGLTALYLSRLLFIYQPEYDTKKSYHYLASHMSKQDVVLMIRETNHYISETDIHRFTKTKPLPNVILISYLEREKRTGNYKAFSDKALAVLQRLKETKQNIWFYRQAGNDEMFGANLRILQWFGDNGYVLKQSTPFKRVELLRFSL